MKLLNPFILMYEDFLEAETITQKTLTVIFALWFSVLLFFFILGMTGIIYTLITDPSAFDRATWGIFDTLG